MFYISERAKYTHEPKDKYTLHSNPIVNNFWGFMLLWLEMLSQTWVYQIEGNIGIMLECDNFSTELVLSQFSRLWTRVHPVHQTGSNIGNKICHRHWGKIMIFISLWGSSDPFSKLYLFLIYIITQHIR